MIARPAVALLVLAACGEPPSWEGTFDVPGAVTVLQSGTGGPFNDPIAYGSSTDGGQIAILDLRKGIYLADEAEASFVRGAPLPTGRNRVIAGLAAYAPDEAHIDVWAADRAYAQLLRVPHVIGLDGVEPVRIQPAMTRAVFVDADGSGEAVTVDDPRLRIGYTSTEDWVFEFDGTEWHATGSRSGRQERPVLPGIRWAADQRALELTIRGWATPGDKVTLSTWSGIEEFDLGGVPMALALSPDQRWLAVSVTDPDADTSWLRIVDPATGSVLGDAALPADAVPGRLAWTPDSATLYVSDFRNTAVWAVAFDSAGAGAVTEYALPWPVFDVAALRQPNGFDLLYVAPVEGREVWLYDPRVQALRDFNPVQPGVNGLDFDTPVRGVEPLPLEYEWPSTDDDGIRPWGRSVAVSLYNGSVVFMADGDGCLVADPLGPRTQVDEQTTGNQDYTTNFDTNGGAFLEPNATNDRSVLVNRCSGVALREAWTLRYRRDLQAWEVEGSRSGVQTALAYEDTRYVSDTGAVSFVIRGGILPSEDGWRISFSVLQGAVVANGDVDQDGTRDVEFDLPGDPAYFHHDTIEVHGDEWVEVRDSPFVLVPASGADLLGRIDPRNGDVEVTWW